MRGVSVLGRKVGNFFLLIVAIIFAALIIYCLLLFFAPDVFAGATENINSFDYKGVSIVILTGIAILIGAVMTAILFFWLKYCAEKRTRKNNIAQLKLLNRMLFDGFDNLLKEDGLFEEAWNSLPYPNDELIDKAFRRGLKHARDFMRKTVPEASLCNFELAASNILSKDSKTHSKVIVNCEKEGLALVELLLGAYFVKMNFEELELMLYRATFGNYTSLEDSLFKKFGDTVVCICPFEEQFDLLKEFLPHQNNLSESLGLLSKINDLSTFIFTHSKVKINC